MKLLRTTHHTKLLIVFLKLNLVKHLEKHWDSSVIRWIYQIKINVHNNWTPWVQFFYLVWLNQLMNLIKQKIQRNLRQNLTGILFLVRLIKWLQQKDKFIHLILPCWIVQRLMWCFIKRWFVHLQEKVPKVKRNVKLLCIVKNNLLLKLVLDRCAKMLKKLVALIGQLFIIQHLLEWYYCLSLEISFAIQALVNLI